MARHLPLALLLQVLHPNLTLGEAHQVARLVRATLLSSPTLGWIGDVDVDLELDDRLHTDAVAHAPWRRADAARRESSQPHHFGSAGAGSSRTSNSNSNSRFDK
jgi:hypothetical protein